MQQEDMEVGMKDRLILAVALLLWWSGPCGGAEFESFFPHDSAQVVSLVTHPNGMVLVLWAATHDSGLFGLDRDGSLAWSKVGGLGDARALVAWQEEVLVCSMSTRGVQVHRFDAQTGQVKGGHTLWFFGAFEWGDLVVTAQQELVVAVTVSYPGGHSNIHLVKLDPESGRTVRSRMDVRHAVYVEAMCLSRKGGLWIVGGEQREQRLSGLVMRVTDRLDRQWSTILPGDPDIPTAAAATAMSGAFAVVEREDGSAVISAATLSDDHRPYLRCTALSDTGQLQWQLSAGQNPTPCDGTALFTLPDQRILVTGNRAHTDGSAARFLGLGLLVIGTGGQPLQAASLGNPSPGPLPFGRTYVNPSGEVIICLNRRGEGNAGLLIRKYETLDTFLGESTGVHEPLSLDGIQLRFPPVSYGRFTDTRDGRQYRTVRIGQRVWFAQDFAGRPANERESPIKGIWTADQTDSASEDRALLYSLDQAIAMTPPGWRLPSKDDWQELIALAGGAATAGRRLRAEGVWDGRQTQPCGFDALPRGLVYRDGQEHFEGMGSQARYWANHETQGGVMQVGLSINSPAVSLTYASPAFYGLAVRFCRDVAPESPAAPQPKASLESRRDQLRQKSERLRERLRRLRSNEK